VAVMPKMKTWRHKFVCLAYVGQQKAPTTDAEKDELFQAGLGEREVVFECCDVDHEQMKDKLYEIFPRLKEGGGFQLLKCLPNSRMLELLSMAAHTSPAVLKERVGKARTYIRPIQRDLDLTPVEVKPTVVSSAFII